MVGPSADDVRKTNMITLASAHVVYVEAVRAAYGQEGLDRVGEANRLHGIELGKAGLKDGGLRKGDLSSIFDFFVAAHPYFGFELELTDATNDSVELKVLACPWIDTFRALQANEDVCHWVCKMDEGIAQALDPELRMSLPKCMMRGDEFCIYRWDKEAD
ncbi:MAG: L-2-amino-thiazoline-4-carboxylic acid hydrolase [Candidatus Thorarchaeota archaeon]|jgi:hypothetical protein